MTPEEHELLTRIDERQKRIEGWMKSLSNTLKTNYVTRTEFQPVKLLVYGFVALMLTGVVGALMTLVIRSKG